MAKRKNTAILNPGVSVGIEYDANANSKASGERETREFDDAYAARRFYVNKDKAGRNPRVKAGTLPTEDAPATNATPAAPKVKVPTMKDVLAEKILGIKPTTNADAPATNGTPTLTTNAAAASPAADKAAARAAAKRTATAAAEPAPVQPAKAKAEDDAASKEPAVPKTPGVSNVKTRYYYAAQIIKRRGLAAGVDDAAVAELDQAYGKQNQVESMIALRNTWQVLRANAE